MKLFRAQQIGILSENNFEIERDNSDVWLSKKDNITVDDGYKCNICKIVDRKNGLHLHHIIPLAEYGTNNKNNLVLLCHNCHQKQHRFKISSNNTNDNINDNIEIRQKKLFSEKKERIMDIPQSIKCERDILHERSPEAAELALYDTAEGRSNGHDWKNTGHW